jgi:hypothetical protein
MSESAIDLSAHKVIPRDFRFLYKSLPRVENGGVHVDVYLPAKAPASESGFPLAL